MIHPRRMVHFSNGMDRGTDTATYRDATTTSNNLLELRISTAFADFFRKCYGRTSGLMDGLTDGLTENKANNIVYELFE